jgi:hypothetical protein
MPTILLSLFFFFFTHFTILFIYIPLCIPPFFYCNLKKYFYIMYLLLFSYVFFMPRNCFLYFSVYFFFFLRFGNKVITVCNKKIVITLRSTFFVQHEFYKVIQPAISGIRLLQVGQELQLKGNVLYTMQSNVFFFIVLYEYKIGFPFIYNLQKIQLFWRMTVTGSSIYRLYNIFNWAEIFQNRITPILHELRVSMA